MEYYFAYGSNLSHDFLIERLKNGEWLSDGWHKTGTLEGPFPIDLGTFVLLDYEFGYTLDIGTETAGNVIPKTSSKVYGAAYQISREQLEELDRSEDVPEDYLRIAVIVDKVASSVFSEGSIEAWVYVGQPHKCTDKTNPDPDYVDLLVNSATQRNFPQEYIDNYLQVPVTIK